MATATPEQAQTEKPAVTRAQLKKVLNDPEFIQFLTDAYGETDPDFDLENEAVVEELAERKELFEARTKLSREMTDVMAGELLAELGGERITSAQKAEIQAALSAHFTREVLDGKAEDIQEQLAQIREYRGYQKELERHGARLKKYGIDITDREATERLLQELQGLHEYGEYEANEEERKALKDKVKIQSANRINKATGKPYVEQWRGYRFKSMEKIAGLFHTQYYEDVQRWRTLDVSKPKLTEDYAESKNRFLEQYKTDITNLTGLKADVEQAQQAGNLLHSEAYEDARAHIRNILFSQVEGLRALADNAIKEQFDRVLKGGSIDATYAFEHLPEPEQAAAGTLLQRASADDLKKAQQQLIERHLRPTETAEAEALETIMDLFKTDAELQRLSNAIPPAGKDRSAHVDHARKTEERLTKIINERIKATEQAVRQAEEDKQQQLEQQKELQRKREEKAHVLKKRPAEQKKRAAAAESAKQAYETVRQRAEEAKDNSTVTAARAALEQFHRGKTSLTEEIEQLKTEENDLLLWAPEEFDTLADKRVERAALQNTELTLEDSTAVYEKYEKDIAAAQEELENAINQQPPAKQEVIDELQQRHKQLIEDRDNTLKHAEQAAREQRDEALQQLDQEIAVLEKNPEVQRVIARSTELQQALQEKQAALKKEFSAKQEQELEAALQQAEAAYQPPAPEEVETARQAAEQAEQESAAFDAETERLEQEIERMEVAIEGYETTILPAHDTLIDRAQQEHAFWQDKVKALADALRTTFKGIRKSGGQTKGRAEWQQPPLNNLYLHDLPALRSLIDVAEAKATATKRPLDVAALKTDLMDTGALFQAGDTVLKERPEDSVAAEVNPLSPAAERKLAELVEARTRREIAAALDALAKDKNNVVLNAVVKTLTPFLEKKRIGEKTGAEAYAFVRETIADYKGRSTTAPAMRLVLNLVLQNAHHKL